MAIRRCPHCGLVNPAKTMTCDCGYSFVDGSPPRFAHDKAQLGGGDVASRFMTRVVFRVVLLAMLAGLAFAIRNCS